MHPEDQKAYEHLAQTWNRMRAQLTPEQIRKLEAEEDDLDPPSNHPALNPKTRENLTMLFDAYQKKGKAGLQKRFDQLFPEKK